MKTLGFLGLENSGKYHGEHPDFGPGIVDVSSRVSHPIWRKIPGAWSHNVVLGDPALEDKYVKAAKELVQEGADAISTDCGFTVRYQQAIAAAVSVPVSTSSLLLLPTLLLNVPSNKKVAVLTADSRYLDAGIMATLGVTQPSRLVVEGLENTATYSYLWAEKGEIKVEDVLGDIDNVITRVRQHDSIGAILCECTVFVRVSARIRKATGLPVLDAANNAALLMAAVVGR